MKKVKLLFVSAVLAVVVVSLSFARDIDPIVSTDWLEKNLNDPKLAIIDIRKVEDYKINHIPNAVNIFYGTLAIDNKGLKNELPEEDDFMEIITGAGISNDSLIVIAGTSDSLTDLVNMPRIVWTLKYAGLNNVAILDGGNTKWIKEQKAVSSEPAKPKNANFKPKWNKNILATKELVLKQTGKSTIIDDRSPDTFYGIVKLDFIEKAGHIKSAVSLPSSWLFTKDNVFKSKEDIQAIAEGVIGKNKKKEMITYCDTGRLGAGWWFVLSEVLGYENVKLYDGSMQEWTKDADAPVIKYSWQ